MKKKLLGLVLFYFLVAVGLWQASAKAAAEDDPFKVGDQAYRERAEPKKAREAIAIYREIYRKNPTSESAWRVAMSCYFVGLKLTADESEKTKIFAEGRAAGLFSSEKSPHCAACHFWTAINMALYGQTVGVFKTLFTLKDIQRELKQSLEIDPTYAHAGAYRLLGLIQQNLPGILGGSNSEAKAYFKKAMETAPDEPLNYFFMAKLMRQMHLAKAALEFAKLGEALPKPAIDRPESIEAQENIQTLIKELAMESQIQRKMASEVQAGYSEF